MIQAVRLSLYEIFGYILPGAVLLLALQIALITAFHRSAALIIVPTSWWHSAMLLPLAYFAGHGVQSAAGFVARYCAQFRWLAMAKDVPPEVMRAITARAGCFVPDLEQLQEPMRQEWVIKIADVACFGTRCEHLREVYEYRSGFTRGVSIASATVAAVLFARAMIAPMTLELADSGPELSQAELAILSVVMAVLAVLCFKRYRQFEKHHVHLVLLAFLTECRDTDSSPGTCRPGCHGGVASR